MRHLSWSFPCTLVSIAVAAGVAGTAVAETDPRVVAAHDKAIVDFPPCAKTASPTDVETATAAHKQAGKYFDHGEYDKAIRAWSDAYSFDCSRPSVFLNLANSYEPNDKATAIALLELYEERAPTANRQEIDTRINGMRAALGPPPATTSPTPAHPGPPVPPIGPQNPGPTAPSAVPGDTVTERPFGAAPWVVVAIGAVVLVSGAPVLAVGRVKVADAATLCPTHTGCSNASAAAGNVGNTMTGAGIGLLAAGGAVLIGGLVWQFAGNAPRPVQKPRTALHFAPVVSPTFNGGFVTGTF